MLWLLLACNGEKTTDVCSLDSSLSPWSVDNTIHYLYRYKINTSNKLNYNQAIEKTHQNVGKAIMTTSLAISLGFLTLTLSNFVPTIIFGLFTSLAMLFALIGVLITLPSILYYLK